VNLLHLAKKIPESAFPAIGDKNKVIGMINDAIKETDVAIIQKVGKE
jgi:hypothetical protein